VKKRKTDSMNSTGTAIYVFNGVVPSNPLITTLEEKLKPYIFHFLDSVSRQINNCFFFRISFYF
jgi:hypothetical protein